MESLQQPVVQSSHALHDYVVKSHTKRIVKHDGKNDRACRQSNKRVFARQKTLQYFELVRL